MYWPEISKTDILELDCVFQDFNYKNCLKTYGYSGFVFFDIGSVLLDLDWDAYINEFLKLLPDPSFKDHKETFRILKKDSILEKWCTGKIGSFDYALSFIHALKKSAKLRDEDCTISIYDIKKADSIVVGAVRQNIIELAKNLRKKNFGIGVLSNATTWHEVVIEKRIPVREIFDVTIFSQDLGCEKPDPKIYDLAFLEARNFILNKFNVKLNTKDVYFIDDTPANVRAARNVGWNAGLVNLINDDTLKNVLENRMNDEDLKIASKKRENLVFGYEASKRVEKIFGNLIKI